ncbi:cell shape-determining protein [Tenacibaculum sp. Bg11-29]|uniref:cation:proton antiporter n=1 Tax=Tenacibaculum sp. Bg11-29 TaxID=2058306 RepID=UPI000C33BFD8|nr:sodium:proton antiporter [Tenacibaculum sp. Bg11-29]PKH52133.1 cell shape-determining protein [Tenacibaculum sp. Bg11-29]
MVELAGIIILGILAQWVAWKFKIPAILPLILIGLLVGPIASEFLSADGNKWIEPVWNGQKGLFPGESLFYFVSLAISIILFEGGLTLKLSEVKNVGPVITKLITLGSAVTFFGAAIAVYYIFNLSWEISFLFSGLIIVTGPTVITPILRNIPLKKDIAAVLKWEGILIDPIGALVAVLVFEFISVGGGHTFTKTALIEFGKIVLFGTTFGFTFASGLIFAMKKKLIPHYLLNVFVLASVLGVFVLSDTFAHESGLLAVVVMGMVLGNSNLPQLKELLYFKESLSVLLISILFILLSANINIKDLLLIYNWQTLLLFASVVFIIRPLGVFLSTINSTLKFNEKLFISWVGPRGIVAAGIASLFGLKLAKEGIAGAEYITPLVFMIVLGTVLLNATTARFISKITGVFLKKSEGILIIGASEASRVIAKYFNKIGKQVVLIDTNKENINKANKLGIEALNVDIYSDELVDNIELNNIGYLIALTGNTGINKYAIEKFKNQFGENGAYRISAQSEVHENDTSLKNEIFSCTNNFLSLSEVARTNPTIHELEVETKEEYIKFINKVKNDEKVIPLFIKSSKNQLNIISENNNNIDTGSTIVYLGRKINDE